MPSSLQKVQKHVNKKKGAKASALHEFSRDARRLRRAGNRDEKVSRSNKIQRMSNNQWTERTAFFRDQLPDVLHPFETAEIQHLIEEYLARHDEELAELRRERREGRPKSTRQVQLEQAVDVERKEYVSGYWMPDLQDFESLQKMEAWNGEWTGLANLRFARVDSEGRVKTSQFPPKGGSWQNTKKDVVKLPDFGADIVRRWLRFAYGGPLIINDVPDDFSTGASTSVLAQLYAFGEYIQDISFRLCVLDTLISRICEPDTDGKYWYPNEGTVTIVHKAC
ncbi:hypothetical protein B0A48_06788 [Cryoendolithus antarcticus]|uniref:Uncharacterized protein n=1 Tax=Cryoendolithus antarcticus TaxID=1507870 RepID=A0A1V8T9B9_9PEZI|nr:hypothetical protein B0A48_06788 [Cryoendolithus antarcticus]